jgi:holliday junction DNA helicase RuvA
MIGRLRGLLVEKRPPWLTLEVGGVGYEVEAPMSTFYKLPEAGVEVTLRTHLVVREDAHLLYGFATESERRLFRELIKVNGIGARLALGILSGMEPEALVTAVQQGETARLIALPGIGKKTAERLIVELRDRLAAGEGFAPAATGASAPGPLPSAEDPVGDAVSALIALGYRPNDASRYVQAAAEPGLSREELIRRALRSLLPGP